MRLADYVIERLADAGIQHAFGVAGGGAIFLDDAVEKSERIKFVPCHHEQAAAMAAESYARAREGLGLCLVTSGPGATNAITGCVGAWTDSVPVIFISGQVFSKQMITSEWRSFGPKVRTLGTQEINIVDMVKPVTKFATIIDHSESIRSCLDTAIHRATNGRPGPVWLDIPADIQNEDIDPEKLHPARKEVSHHLILSDVERVSRQLHKAKRPLLHVGQGIRLSGAILDFIRFAEVSGIPVMTARNGNDLIPSDHPQFVGRPGTFPQRGANFAVQCADFYLAVGTRLSLAQTGYDAKDYARNAWTCQVDIDEAELRKDTVRLSLGIQADAREFLRALMGMGPWPDWSPWLAKCKGWQEKYRHKTYPNQPSAFADSYDLVDVLSRYLEPTDIIVTDMGLAFQGTHQTFRVKAGQRLYTNCGTAAMGWGLPAAVGAAIGTGRRVIAIVGDGGLMMNLQELSTVIANRLDLKIFLLNNQGYATMRQSQDHAFGRRMGESSVTGLAFPNFATLSAAFGFTRYHRCSSAAGMRSAVMDALGRVGPEFIEVRIDPDQAQHPRAINRRDEQGRIFPTKFEDLWPHLDPEVIAQELKEGVLC